jgi:hypothetical protein
VTKVVKRIELQRVERSVVDWKKIYPMPHWENFGNFERRVF